jgi:hypothetical protein
MRDAVSLIDSRELGASLLKAGGLEVKALRDSSQKNNKTVTVEESSWSLSVNLN